MFLKPYLRFTIYTVQKMKFSIKDFFSKCGQIRSFLRIWSHLLKKSLMRNFIFSAVIGEAYADCECKSPNTKLPKPSDVNPF